MSDELIARDKPPRVMAPEGPKNSVCCDVVDLGMIQSTFNNKVTNKRKVRIVWEIEDQTPDGKRFTISRRFTLSLADNSALRPFLEHWRGKAFTQTELAGFDLSKLVGVPAFIQITHDARNGEVWDNVSAIMRLPQGLSPLVVSPTYVRVKDRPVDKPNGQQRPQQWASAPVSQRPMQSGPLAGEVAEYFDAQPVEEDDELPF